MKSSFEELLRDLQIISKELFLSSWNTCISHKLKHSQIKQPHTLTEPSGKTNFGSPPAKPEDYLLLVTVRPPAGLSRRASTARLSAGFKQKGEPSFRKVPLFASILFPYEILLPGATSPPGTIKTIGFRLPTCRASNFPRTAGRNSTHRPQVRHDGSLPRTVEGKP